MRDCMDGSNRVGEGQKRWRPNKLAVAVSAATAGLAASTAAQPSATDVPRIVETMVVTASKRSESIQDVSIPVQALTGEGLRSLGVETFDQYVNFLPNVASAGNGPGKKDIYLRGSATEQSGPTVSTQQGSAPGVALYVDEQPVSFGGRNLDVYGADLERIEVLSGPQGTLFGASSQSGNVRLITRKPDPTGFGAGFNAHYGVTNGGGESVAGDAFLNLPLSDALALRLVVYSDTQGGWIDNVPATFTPSAEVVDRNSVGYGPSLASADSVVSARNDALVQDDWNEASYQGGRLGLLYGIHDDWDVLVQHTSQRLVAEGSFLIDPSLEADHATANFTPDFNQDDFGLTTWTLKGRLASLDVVYAGGHLSRQVDNVVDYTHYNAGGGYITYYLCSGNIYDSADPNNCYDPTKQYTDASTNTRTTHEIHVSSDPARRWHFLGGIYVNESEATHLGDYHYYSVREAFSEHISNYNNDDSGEGFLLGNVTLPTAGVVSAGPRPPNVAYFNDYTRTEDEVAFFGEVAVDLTDRWSFALSARRYDLVTALQGASNFSFGCRYGIGSNALETADGRCNGNDFGNDVTLRLQLLGQYAATGDDGLILNARSPNGEDGSPRDMFRGGGSNEATLNAIKSGALSLEGLQPDGTIEETDTILKATLTWAASDSTLLFATFSEGYRPAALNRNAGQFANVQTGVFENYAVPPVALTDHLFNYELGMKGDFMAGILRINATTYRTRIEDLQVSRYDPINVAFNYYLENVGDAESQGLDVDFNWLPTDALSVAGAFSWLNTELTALNAQLSGVSVPVGAELPLSPRFAGNLRVRYDCFLPKLDANGYLSASVVYRGESLAGLLGKAEFMDDTVFQHVGRYSGLKTHYEGGTFGAIEIEDPATGARRLPMSTRFVNPAATTINAALGIERDGWRGELYMNNLGNEPATMAQVGGRYMPAVTEQRPRSIGLRISFEQ